MIRKYQLIVVLATKCVGGRIVGLTNRKKELLDNEYSEFNRLARFLSAFNSEGLWEFCEYSFVKDKFNLYSLTKQQALRNCQKANGEQPLMITQQSIRIETNSNSKLSKLWVRISVFGVRGGIWLPVKTSVRNLELVKCSETYGIKIIKKKNNYYISITIQKEVVLKSCSNILAIDLGEKIMATVCGTAQKNPLFLGREVRGIRRHYSWLRKKLGNKKLLKKIKEIGKKESHKVDSCLHVISRRIVEVANTSNSLIVLGDLKGIRKSAKKKGKRFNRIVSNMPFFKLTEMIEYKAKWLGIPVEKISEKYTSRTCSNCGHCDKKNRKSQGLFKCEECGLELNADYNASKNILDRSLEQCFNDGVLRLRPKLTQEVRSTRIKMCKAVVCTGERDDGIIDIKKV